MEPSREAREWGKRQASKAPRWDEAKWQRIATILQVDLVEPQQDDEDQGDEQLRAAA